MPKSRKRSSFHISELTDACAEWLRSVCSGGPAGTYEPTTLVARNGVVYLSVASASRITYRSRVPVHRAVRRAWARPDVEPCPGTGVAITARAFEAIALQAGIPLGEALAAITEDRLDPPRAKPEHPVDATTQDVLVAEARRLIDGQASAFALERRHVRFSCGDAGERAHLHHLTLAHGLRGADLWDTSAPSESTYVRRKLGRPVDARKLLALLVLHMGDAIADFANALSKCAGRRERDALPGRTPPSRKGQSKHPDPPELRDWLREGLESGRLSDAQVFDDTTALRHEFYRTHPDVWARVRADSAARWTGGLPSEEQAYRAQLDDTELAAEWHAQQDRRGPETEPEPTRANPAAHEPRKRTERSPVADAITGGIVAWLDDPQDARFAVTVVDGQVCLVPGTLARLIKRKLKEVHSCVFRWRKLGMGDLGGDIPIQDHILEQILDAADMDLDAFVDAVARNNAGRD